ncbi:MAG: FliG C-terminal domain-containing protein, partial [Paracoccaceae bacterium]
LNSTPATTRDQVLDGLLSQDPSFGEGVRKAIFTFADIPERVTPLDVPKLARDVDQAQIVTAMAGAAEGTEQTAVEFLLSNMSKRMAQTLREEVSDRGQVARKDGEAAQSVIVAAIRDMVASGEITLRKPDEED